MLPEPRLSMCEFTTLRASFAEDLDAYRAGGFGGIGLVEFKLGEGDEERLRASGLCATVCIPSVPSILPLPLLPGPTDPAERIDALRASIRRLARFDPVAVNVLTGPGPEQRGLVVDGIKRLLEVADETGVTLALEPFHASQRDTFSFVNSIEEACELLAEADAERVRIVFDTWQLGDTPGIEAQIAAHAELIAAVHVADRREPTRNDFDRVLPGDGVLPLPRILRALRDAGYQGWYEIEIFSDDGSFGQAVPDSLWTLSAAEMAGRARAAFDDVWSQT